MPTYEYKCDACGKPFEKFQSIKADPIKVCPNCGAEAVRRLISAGAGFIFKGSGFYITDYRDKGYADQAKADSAGGDKPAGDKGDKPAGDKPSGDGAKTEGAKTDSAKPAESSSTAASTPAATPTPTPSPTPAPTKSE